MPAARDKKILFSWRKKRCDFSSAGLSLRFRPRSIPSRNYKKTLTLIFGVVVFLAGLVLSSFVALGVNGIAGDNTLDWDLARRQIVNIGAHLLIGIALTTMGMIIVLFAKSDK